MGVIKNTLITDTDPSIRVNSINDWINENLTEFVTSEVVEETVNDTLYICSKITINANEGIEILFGYEKEPPSTHPNCSWALYSLKKDATTTIIDATEKHTSNNNVADVAIYAYLDSSCVIFSINEKYNNKPGVEIVNLIISESEKLFGYANTATSTSNFTDISTLTYSQVNDVSNVPYSYSKMFQYTAPIPSIDFLGCAYFVNGNGYKSFKTEFLRECSYVDVSNLPTVSLTDGNYVAVGSHCLAPIEDQGGET